MSTSVFAQTKTSFNWSELPNIPDNVGFAGSFSGISNNALIVTGGANFPDGGAPWTGSKKVWHDDIFILDSPDGDWKVLGKLPQPLGYGVSISSDQGLILIGGNNEDKHFADVLLLQYREGAIETKRLPDLPKPLANSAGVILNNVIYVLGGTVDHQSKEAENNFWSLDLDNPSANWKEMDSWPGPSRMLAVAGVQDDAIYLFSGAHLKDGAREYLKDAYKYSLNGGWKKIADLPNSIVAAPSPAFTDSNDNLIVFGGDDGTLTKIDLLKERHPGFSRAILSYNNSTDSWSEIGTQSGYAAVTTPLVVWREKVIIPGGEIMPSVRTTKVVVIEPVD